MTEETNKQMRKLSHMQAVALLERRRSNAEKARKAKLARAKIEGSKEDVAAYLARVPPKRY